MLICQNHCLEKKHRQMNPNVEVGLSCEYLTAELCTHLSQRYLGKGTTCHFNSGFHSLGPGTETCCWNIYWLNRPNSKDTQMAKPILAFAVFFDKSCVRGHFHLLSPSCVLLQPLWHPCCSLNIPGRLSPRAFRLDLSSTQKLSPRCCKFAPSPP